MNWRASRLADYLLDSLAKREDTTLRAALETAIACAWRVATKDLNKLPPLWANKGQRGADVTEETRLKIEEIARAWGLTLNEAVTMALWVTYNLPPQGDLPEDSQN